MQELSHAVKECGKAIREGLEAIAISLFLLVVAYVIVSLM